MTHTTPITLCALLALTTLLTATQPAKAAQTCNDSIQATTPTSRFTLHGDGTVTDTATGLMWMQCALGQSGSDCASGTATTHTWKDALAAAEATTFAGHSDWRLPNIKELASMVELKCHDPAVNLAVFPNTPSTWFWSSSPSAYSTNSAWGVYFKYGNDDYDNDKYANYHVRVVRSGQ